MTRKSEIDSLTGLSNEEYLKRNYQDYITKNPKANFIMIDFKKFKIINDTFGHNIGDEYLKVFAQILQSAFSDSLTVRLHGDEFAVVTKYSELDIINKILYCDEKIIEATHKGIIPKIFRYNAGSAPVEKDMSKCQEKADYMMYHAKKSNHQFQSFSQMVWSTKKKQNIFLKKFDFQLKNDKFSYTARPFFNKEGQEQFIYQVYTKDSKGNSLFQHGHYELLRENAKIPNLDVHNLSILTHDIPKEGKTMINIDYRTLLANNNFFDYIEYLESTKKIDFQNIILNINIQGIEPMIYDKMIEQMERLKQLNFKVCLDKYNSKVGDEIWENSEIDYIGFDSIYWKKAMLNPKLDYVLKRKVDMFSSSKEPSIPIFTMIEQEPEHEYLTSFLSQDALLSGNYYSEEKPLSLKKRKK